MNDAPPFVRFGLAHAAVLAATAAAAVGLALLVRRRPRLAPIVRLGLILALIGFTIAYLRAVAGEGRISVWDVKSAKPVAMLTDQYNGSSNLCYSPDGRRIVHDHSSAE